MVGVAHDRLKLVGFSVLLGGISDSAGPTRSLVTTPDVR